MRKSSAKKRPLLPDPKFNEQIVTQFVNNLMLDGKKNTAFTIFYDALEVIEDKKIEEEKTALDIFKVALTKVSPSVEVRSRRIGGATFQIPRPIRDERKVSMGMKWLISFARKRNEKTMAQKLAGEIIASYKEESPSFKKKEDTHRMADANKAFSHFRF